MKERGAGGTKILKRGGKLGQGVGSLKGELETPYELCSISSTLHYARARNGQLLKCSKCYLFHLTIFNLSVLSKDHYVFKVLCLQFLNFPSLDFGCLEYTN